MSTQDDRSEAARALNLARWHGQVASRAAATFIERIDEVPDAQVAEVERAIAERKGQGDD